jgi:putative transposase
MPRTARLRIPGLPLHIVHRGHNRKPCFFRDADYLRYLRMLEQSSQQFECEVHAFVLMTNHVHLLVSPREASSISWFMKRVAQEHAQYINKALVRSGALWEGRYYSSHVDCDSYLLSCYRYIESNPVRAAIAMHPAEYAWSSFRSNALGYPSSLIRPHDVYRSLGSSEQARLEAYRRLFDCSVSDAELDAIRAATRRCRVLGSPDFLQRLESEVGRSVAGSPHGRPKSAVMVR